VGEREKVAGKGCRKVNKCVHMYVNAGTVPGMGRGSIKENGGRMNSSMIHSIRCKNLCKCHNVPPPSTTIKEEMIETKFSVMQ
jgi:hypothetical protein